MQPYDSQRSPLVDGPQPRDIDYQLEHQLRKTTKRQPPSGGYEDLQKIIYSGLLTMAAILVIFGVARLASPHFGSKNSSFPQDKLTQTLNAARRIDPCSEANKGFFVPQQLHLSLGANSSEIYVTWSTIEPVLETRLVYRVLGNEKYKPPNVSAVKFDESDRGASGTLTRTEIKPNPEWTLATGQTRRILYIYRAKIEDLLLGHYYAYRVESRAIVRAGPDCGSPESSLSEDGRWFHSKIYSFLANNFDDPREPVSIAMFGDLGLKNGQSTRSLISATEQSKFKLVIHNGDFAYDLDTNAGNYGDRFMRAIEPIAARVPYQTSVGNHEAAENFTHYDSRFTMINGGAPSGQNGGGGEQRNNFFYSFNAGPVHFVAISTEFYYFLDSVGVEPLERQYQWLRRDLEAASSAAQRAERPWIVVFGHRPMYCSTRDDDDCTKATNILRKGLPFSHAYALEEMFYDYGVDVQFYSHEHLYERFLPLYDSRVYNGTDSAADPYLNPRAPVHLISGSAGNQENLDPFQSEPVAGSVRQISAYSYTILRASRCRLEFEQVSSDEPGQHKVLDSFNVTKTRLISFPTTSASGINC